jgi:HEAT repeat protein
MLKSKDDKVKVACAQTLAEMGGKKSAAIIAEGMKPVQGEKACMDIALALIKLKDPNGIEKMADYLTDPATACQVSPVRVTMTKALGETKSVLAKDILIKLLGDIDDQVRIEAIKSMEKIKYDDGIYFVVDVVAVDELPEVRMAALDYLKKNGNGKIASELLLIASQKHKHKFDEVMEKIPGVVSEIKKRTGKK